MLIPLIKYTKNIVYNPFLNINFYNKAALPFIAYNVIIGPHGFTDLLYAFEYKKMFQYFGIYSFCSIFFNWLHVNQYNSVINSLFLSLSVIHFKNDVPVSNKYIQLFLSVLFVSNLDKIGLPIFLLYMTFLHVPNHYLTYANLMRKYKYLSYFLITALSIFLCNNNKLIESNNSWIVKSIITSHILFEELYVKEKHKNILNKLFQFDNSRNMAIYI